MKRLAVLGASGHGKVLADIAELSGWSEVVFFDDAFPDVDTVGVWPIKGGMDALLGTLNDFDGCIVAIGNNVVRLEKTLEIQSNKGNLVSLIHPSSVVSRYAKVGIGSVVMAGAVINPYARLGIACIANTSATIDHDCELANGVHISPGANLAGMVKVGVGSWVGIGASVRQGVSIGEGVIVGAGAVVISDTLNNVMVAGIPAKKINKSLNTK